MLAFLEELTGTPFDNMDQVPDRLLRDIFPPPEEDSFRGETIAPEVLPEGQLEPVSLLERLINLKDTSADMKWIEGKGIVISLNKKLSNALAVVRRGNTKAAIGILNAFINELDALRGKKLNDSAFFLLKVNAEFVILRLGG